MVDADVVAHVGSVGMPDTLILALQPHGPTRPWICPRRECSHHQLAPHGRGKVTRHSKRIFLLGPSHHYYLTGCALTKCDTYATPLGNLKIDKETVAELREKGKFDTMNQTQDEEEHSLEMHLPYIYKLLTR